MSSEFPTSQVPASATHSGRHIALIVIGGTIAIPAFLMAATIGASLGLRDAGKAFACGCFVLGCLAACTGLSGQKSGLSAYVLCEFAFGRWGARLTNLAIAGSLLGWFGVTGMMFGRAAAELAVTVFGMHWPVDFYVVLGSVLIVGVTVSGFRGIDKLALALVPAMVLFLGIAAGLSVGSVEDWSTPTGGQPMGLSTAISAVIGSYIAGVTIQPDYSRFASSRKAALWSAFLALGVSFPLVLSLAAVPAMAMSDSDILRVMILLGIGVPAFLLLSLAAWSSNVLSLYSGSLAAATLFRGARLKVIIVVFGIAGTGLALTRVDEYLVDYLILLGITIPPISSIYVVETLLFRSRFDEQARRQRPRIVWRAMIAWLVAVLTGYLAHMETLTLTGVAALDSVSVAATLAVALRLTSRCPIVENASTSLTNRVLEQGNGRQAGGNGTPQPGRSGLRHR